jgi:hypothetical protein
MESFLGAEYHAAGECSPNGVETNVACQCFDHVVIHGCLPLVTRPENIVHFSRDVPGICPPTKQAFAGGTETTDAGWKPSLAFPFSGPIPT